MSFSKARISLKPNLSAKQGYGLVTLCLCLLGLLLLYWRVIRGYTPPVTFASWPEPPHWVDILYSARWVVRFLAIGVGLLLAYLEWLNHWLSRWLSAVLERRLTGFVVISLCGFLLGSYLLQPGHLATGDASPHVPGGWPVLQSIKDGQWFAYWSNYAYFGHPFLQFYSVLYYYLTAFASLVAQNFYQANDLVLIALHTLSAYPMFLYVRQITKSRIAGLVSAIAWSATFYRYHIIVILGKLTLAPFLALWPLQFYFAERLYADKTPRRYWWWCGLALTIGAMLWTHKLYGVWALATGFLYIVSQLVFQRPLNIRQAFLKLVVSGSAYVMGGLIGFYEVMPSYAEQAFTMLSVRNMDQFRFPVVYLHNVLVFAGSYLTDWFGGYIGNTILGVVCIAIILILIARYTPAAAVVIQLLAALFMTFAPAYAPGLFDFIFHHLPQGQLAYASGLSPGVYLLIVIGPACALCGVSVTLIHDGFQTWLPRLHLPTWLGHATEARVGVAVIVLLLAELVPLSLWISIRYPEAYLGDRLGRYELLDYINAHSGQDGTRLVDADAYNNNYFMLSEFTGHPGLLGYMPDVSPLTYQLGENLIGAINQDAAVGRLSPQTAGLLYQMNMSYIITGGQVKLFEGLIETKRNQYAVLWRVKAQAPLMAAASAGTAFKDANVDALTKIPVTVVQQNVTTSLVSLKFALRQRAFIETAYSAYPFQVVTLDGVRQTVTPTDLNMISFWADPGEHTLMISPELSPLRRWSLAISGLATLVCVIGLFGPLWMRKVMLKTKALNPEGAAI